MTQLRGRGSVQGWYRSLPDDAWICLFARGVRAFTRHALAGERPGVFARDSSWHLGLLALSVGVGGTLGGLMTIAADPGTAGSWLLGLTEILVGSAFLVSLVVYLRRPVQGRPDPRADVAAGPPAAPGRQARPWAGSRLWDGLGKGLRDHGR